ncbi:MAG: DUF790 family protein [Myxococcales bacterium]|nr:DUF790 family protein [Myxococcales bacterium]
MLTGNLLRFRVHGGVVKPGFLDPREHLVVAEQVIELVRSLEGETRDVLEAELKDAASIHRDERLVHGLVSVLLDDVDEKMASPHDPGLVRSKLFALAGPRQPLGPVARAEVVAAVAAELASTTEAIEQSLYADLPSAARLGATPDISPEALLARYDLRLAQGLLLAARSMTLTLTRPSPKRLRALMRALKFQRLLFTVAGQDGVWTLQIDGPGSPLTSSARYGVQFANVLPALLHDTDWSLTGDCIFKTRAGLLKLGPELGLQPLRRETGMWTAAEETALAERLTTLAAPWQVSFDGELVVLDGQHVLLPDLVLRDPETGREALIEIVWRWRRAAFERRWEVLRRIGPKNLVLAIATSEKAGDGALPALPGPVHGFKQVPNARTLLSLCRDVASVPSSGLPP